MISSVFVSLSMYAFTACMSGPAPFAESALLMRLVSNQIIDDRDTMVVVSASEELVRVCASRRVGTTFEAPPPADCLECIPRRVHPACLELEYDDYDVDLRDWAGISNRVAQCAGGNVT